jgi:DNA-binding response OmpR family regulator
MIPSQRADDQPVIHHRPPQVDHPRRILLVDDYPDSADSLSLILSAVGHQVDVAHGGLAALTRADEFRPDTAILDIGLPDLDGFEVARRLRSAPWGRNLVLIAVTGWDRDDHRTKSAEVGFDRHFVKPVDVNELRSFLRSLGEISPEGEA